MNATFDFDRLLASVLEADGPQAVSPSVIDAALSKARLFGQRRPLVQALDRRAWPPRRYSLGNPAVARVAMLGLVLLLTLALIAAGLFIGSQLSHRRAPPILTDTTLPGAWFTTADAMRIQRTGDASATLQDGRVLFVGGEGVKYQGPLTSGTNPTHGELFDPTTNAFEPTVGMMSPARDALTATTLSDGRVLVTGGFEGNDDGSETPFAASELFDPKTGTFSPTGDMVVPRAHHTATLLPDGRVLVVGGGLLQADGTEVALASAELYDPRTGAWKAVGSMAQPRVEHTATLLSDATVLVAGGWSQTPGGSPMVVDTAEIFDPSTGAFKPGSPLITPRAAHSATALRDGRVLLVGGYDPSRSDPWKQYISSAELYDPATGQFAATGPLVTERSRHSAALLLDGRVLISGGINWFDDTRSAEIYDPVAGTFEVGASLAAGTIGPSVALVDGRVLVPGTPAELFDPRASTTIHPLPSRSDATFVATGGPLQDRSGHTATRLLDGRVLIAGGFGPGSGPVLASAEIYDPRSGSFTATGSMATSRSWHSALLLHDGRVLIAGGRQDAATTADMEIYDPGTGYFSAVGQVPGGSDVVTGTPMQLADDRIVVFGPPGDRDTPVYRFDLVTETATAIGSLPDCRGVRSAVPLPDGTAIAVCASQLGHSTPDSARLFDPRSGTSSIVDLSWTFLGSLSLAPMANGRILLSDVQSANLGIFDPATRRVVKVGGLIDLQGNFSAAAALADGRILITGASEAAVWDPSSGTNTKLPPPIATRDGHTETLLNDGRVLIVGGTHWPGDHDAPHPAGAELFDPTAVP